MSATGQPLPFDVCADLPTGVTVLEASAGTGKTYTIAALAARYVADGFRAVKTHIGGKDQRDGDLRLLHPLRLQDVHDRLLDERRIHR